MVVATTVVAVVGGAGALLISTTAYGVGGAPAESFVVAALCTRYNNSCCKTVKYVHITTRLCYTVSLQ